jgi:mRNA interferase HigB
LAQHAEVEVQHEGWYKISRNTKWKSLTDINAVFPYADLVGACTVFDIKGNDYRLIVKINFTKRTVYIKGLYTHAEYSKNRWKNECNC